MDQRRQPDAADVSPTAPIVLGTVVAGRYRIDGLVGRGGAGAVWRATDRTLGRQVAIKVLHPELETDDATRTRFRREAVAAAALNHPNVVAIYDIGVDDGRPFLVMELVDGSSLARDLRDGPLEPARVAEIGHQVASALGAAHARGLIHRDVKPANILVTSDGVAKVADFGIAKVVHEAQSSLTTAGSVLGTAAYVAPEQLTERHVDARTDVYALGLVLHQCLTGRRPFNGDTPASVAAARLERDPEDLSRTRPDLPETLTRAVTVATRRTPADRFADGAAFAAALAPVLTHARRPVPPLATGPDRTQPLDLGAIAAPDPADATRRIEATGPQTRTARLDPSEHTHAPDGSDPAAAPTAHDARSARDAAAATADATAASRSAGRTGQEPPAAGTDHRDGPPPPRRSRGGDRRGADGGPPGDGGPSGPDRPASGPGSPTRRRRRVVAALAVIAVVVAGIAVATTIGGGGTGLLEVASADAVDPLGDGNEYGEQAAATIDGDPDTAWRSERYNTRDFGGLKPGVGLAYDLGQRRSVDTIELRLDEAGLEFAVYALDDAPEGDPSSWGDPVVRRTAAGRTPSVDVGGTTARHWVVWITALPPSRRATVAEVRFLG